MNGEVDPLMPGPPVEVVELIALAVQACPAVSELHGGRFGQTTTYLPGRRVVGVTMSRTEVTVGVVGRYPSSVAEIAAQVRAAVALIAPGVSVSVHIEDLAVDPAALWIEPAVDPISTHSTLATPLAPLDKERPS